MTDDININITGASYDEEPYAVDLQRSLVASSKEHDYANNQGAKFGVMRMIGVLSSFLVFVCTLFVDWPAQGIESIMRMPNDYIKIIQYAISILFIWIASKLNLQTDAKLGGATLFSAPSEIAKSANKIRKASPWLITLLIMASAAAFSSHEAAKSANPDITKLSEQQIVERMSCTPSSGEKDQGPIKPIEHLNIPYKGQWFPEGFSNSHEENCNNDLIKEDKINLAIHTGATVGSQTALYNSTSIANCKGKMKGLPMFHAHPDSGCTGSVTDDCSRLINVRPCDEIYGQANGQLTHCTTIGDMPVYAYAKKGNVVQMTIRNVRCVPSFKYTLLSVRQLWKEQQIDARFRDLDHLELPDGNELPYDKAANLYTLVFVSSAAMNTKTQSAPQSKISQAALLGFHQVKATSHISRMASARAGALMHRRSHLGVLKIRNLASSSLEAPTNLANAPAITCVTCAQTDAKKAAHPGKLDTTISEPGYLHVDMKGPFPPSVHGGFRYALIFIDQHTRMTFIEFLKTKDEVIGATKRVLAKFEATVSVRTDEHGKPISKPKVYHLARDREGAYESHDFKDFRAEHGLHSTSSAPDDHDLNPIAESTIRVIDSLATKYRLQSGAPVGFWPELFRHAIDWHNASPTSTGTSTSDPAITAIQRFTGKRPPVMDLCTFGSRVVVLKTTPHRSKGDLNGRGWVGCFLGRSSDTRGTYDAWIPSLNKKVASSSVVIDEEFFPWLGTKAYSPLALSSSHPAAETLGGSGEPHRAENGTFKASHINSTPSVTLKFLDLFSGPRDRKDSLSECIMNAGFSDVEQIENDSRNGGGWNTDLLNDSCYAKILEKAKSGAYDGIMIAFPCSTFSIARFFDASGDGGDKGPQPVRDKQSPDGLSDDLIDPKHRKELIRANRLLERAVCIAIEARKSPRKTTIIWENPADRSIRGTPQFMPEFAEKHGSLFATSEIKRFRDEVMRDGNVSDTSTCTFAACKFGAESQKYTTLLYTNDAAELLDDLDGYIYQCDHPPGTHNKIAGGRQGSGDWRSDESAAYSKEFNEYLAQAFVHARTGSLKPLHRAEPHEDAELNTGANQDHATHAPMFHEKPHNQNAPDSNALPPIPSPAKPPRSPIPFQGFGDNFDPDLTAVPEQVNLGQGVLSESKVVDDERILRSVRRGTRAYAPHPDDAIDDDSSYVEYVPRSPNPKYLESPDAHTAASLMEATVTELVIDAYGTPSPEFSYDPVGPWKEMSENALTARIAEGADFQGEGTWTQEVTAKEALLLLKGGDRKASEHHALLSHLHALRAESEDAPATEAEAQALGGPWPASIQKELDNHMNNGSWATITRSEVPKGRRLHKMVWVFKLKRDGTAKSRLCVQGCTLEKGVDYDQTFAKTLLHSSARGLFAFAARNKCDVRSIDYVAAYLQGEFIDGEDVYCHAPPGNKEIGSDGLPVICRVVKPVYGIPQAGRRLQRKIFPWMSETMGLRQLDDSDACVFVYDDPDKRETFAIGIYVDNLQIVHSAKLDNNGEAIDNDSFYAKFVKQLRKDWEVVDEGPMRDLLGIEIEYRKDGGITLHQNKYIDAMLKRFYPEGITRVNKNPLPYTPELRKRVFEAKLAFGESKIPSHPELVQPFQQKLGSLMYACNASRADIAYPVHQLCQVMTFPTPELMEEVDQVFSYLARNKYVAPGLPIGLYFEPGPSEMNAYSDASFEVKNSTSGWNIFWQSASIIWGSRMQKCISLSSCEAEIYALSEAAKDVIYMRKFIKGLEPRDKLEPTLLRTDNKSARDLSYNPEMHSKTKHIARRHFFVRDMVEAFEISVPLVGTADNYSDFFTKVLDSKNFFRFRNILMNLPSADVNAATLRK